jgi:hypothetical protein
MFKLRPFCKLKPSLQTHSMHTHDVTGTSWNMMCRARHVPAVVFMQQYTVVNRTIPFDMDASHLVFGSITRRSRRKVPSSQLLWEFDCLAMQVKCSTCLHDRLSDKT